MAVLDLEPKDVSLDEPIPSQEWKMLKEFVEESGRESSPVAGLQVAQTQSDSLPSALASCEYSLPISQLRQAIPAKQAHAAEVTAAPAEDQPAAKRQQTAPPAMFEAESRPSMECALQSPFASAENIDHFLEDLPETSPAAQQLQLQQLQQYRQHSAPAPSTLSRALLESQSQELSLQHICSAEQAKARVSTLPTSKLLSCGNLQASLSPVVWRDFEAPHRVMVNLGLRCLEMESNTGYPASMYAAFNPRVITTGVPTKRSHPYRRESSPPDTRQTRSKMTRSASLGSTLTRSHAAPPCPSAKKEHVELEEVYLLKRNPESGTVEETWHIRGPFEGNTLSAPPVWPGNWLIDVLACIQQCHDGKNFWLKAMGRSVPSAPPTQ